MYSICKISDKHPSRCMKQEKTRSKSQVNREKEMCWMQHREIYTVKNQNVFNCQYLTFQCNETLLSIGAHRTEHCYREKPKKWKKGAESKLKQGTKPDPQGNDRG